MGKLPTVFAALGSGSAPLPAVATGTATSLPAMLRRGGLLTVGDAIRTALNGVRTGLRCGPCQLLGLAACEPAAEPQAPPQPFPSVPSEPHRCLAPLLPRPPQRDGDEARSPHRNSSRRCSCERVISIESS